MRRSHSRLILLLLLVLTLLLPPLPALALGSIFPTVEEELAFLCAPQRDLKLREGQLAAPILLYHFVGRETLERGGRSTSRYNVTAADFEAQLQLLQRLGYETVTVHEIVLALQGEHTLPPRPIALTFDDGWIEQYTIAYPLLLKYHMRATFYIPSTYPRGGRYVTWAQVQEMAAAGMEIGSHTRRHVDLTTVDSAELWREVAQSRREIEAQLDAAPTTFAYPYGAYNGAVIRDVAKAGYEGAVALGASPVQSANRNFALNRFEVRGDSDLLALARYLPWLGSGLPLCAPKPAPSRYWPTLSLFAF